MRRSNPAAAASTSPVMIQTARAGNSFVV